MVTGHKKVCGAGVAQINNSSIISIEELKIRRIRIKTLLFDRGAN